MDIEELKTVETAESETVETTETSQKIGAKIYSKFAMIFSSTWIASLTILKALELFTIDETDIIYSGIAIVAVWSPTYLSIWLDKIKSIRFGK